MSLALIFPGQGAQSLGMEFCDEEKRLCAEKILGSSFFSVVSEGPADLLAKTYYSQIAIFLASASLYARLATTNLPPIRAAAGLSLGEYSALYAAGCLSFEQTLLFIKKRAECMQEACTQRPGAMSAVLGLQEAEFSCIEGIEGVGIANYNTPQQFVITGDPSSVKEAGALLAAKGGRVIPLQVEGAFHSPLMRSAQEKLRPYIETLPLKKPIFPLWMNVSAQETLSIEEIRHAMMHHMICPVRWRDTIEALAPSIDLWIEIGPGRTLSAMNRRMGISNTISLQREEGIEELTQLLRSNYAL